ncbi:Uma2 family endonuclease [Kribbella albertanoniae]|uniref:Uma2 family endonuclease n=1 Tax=Kribbella albertanoniae TaxID=1266829 RepID=A0A4R4Q1R8_9ACTN|nr:Uma2 family endonuclease [Kribbella albertanoniae]TDC28936.1 Uma2 family endonuclease [Kribbella albertanoniae]
MTAVPLPPAHLLTVGEYAALGEDGSGRSELMEGNLVMSPSPSPDHNMAALRIALQLIPQLSPDLEVITDVDIDLELAPADQPGFSRRPDVIVVRRSARARVRAEGGLIRASEVLVVVEIVSPGSRRTDNVVKRAEYADAGIPYYWIVDIEDPVSLLACHLTDKFGYLDDQVVGGTFASTAPTAITLDLGDLR